MRDLTAILQGVNRREQWRPILEAEIKRWEVKPCEQLISDLSRLLVTYERAVDARKYQFEVQLLENTDTYVHVGVAVNDESFWGAVRPLSSSFIRQK